MYFYVPQLEEKVRDFEKHDGKPNYKNVMFVWTFPLKSLWSETPQVNNPCEKS